MTGKQSIRFKVLIVTLPGMMMNVLRDTFSRREDIHVVGVATGGLSAVSMIQQKHPDLVVIDSSLPSAERNELIHWLKRGNQQILSLALCETTQQLREAGSAGADLTLSSYSLPDSLDKVFVNLGKNNNRQSYDRFERS